MPPEISRRSACNRCHTLKSRCTTAPGSVSCDRCSRLGIPCKYTRGRSYYASPAPDRSAYPLTRRDVPAGIRYCWTPAAYFADARDGLPPPLPPPPPFGPSPPLSLMHWMSPPHTTGFGVEYVDAPVHHTDWDMLNEGMMLPNSWAQHRPSPVDPTALITPSIEEDIDMDLLIDRAVATLMPPESDAALQGKKADHRVNPAAPAGLVSPASKAVSGHKEGTPRRTTPAAHDDESTPMGPQASPGQPSPSGNLYQQLLDLQGRLYTAAAAGDDNNDHVEKLFKESEILLDILGWLVEDLPKDTRH
ncbi:hypothetical protein DHEL01_v206013 [Diaporthe helianthi]|uniref:Zn(2)-C6 fungal-type domain-containing protein n=1 Tax=Diaporthe helianthi TaxID=158607 RepID=A0A2P5HZA4_DIAHE|nr:hypothetical protein DHEL01_v206013 [Diaporthe helianthi]